MDLNGFSMDKNFIVNLQTKLISYYMKHLYRTSILSFAIASIVGLGITSCAIKHSDKEKKEIAKETDNRQAMFDDLVEKWNTSVNLRDEQLSESLYGPKVRMYTKDMKGKEASDLRIQTATADPTWNQKIISDITLTDEPDGIVKTSFTKQSTSSKGQHTYRAYLIWKKFGDKWLIIKESDTLTDQNINKKKNDKSKAEAKTEKPKAEATSTGQEKLIYKGYIGPYEVKVNMTLYNEVARQGFGTSWDIKGSYTYTKAGNTLRLQGTSNTFSDYVEMDEYTPNGRNSGRWLLEGFAGSDYLSGTFLNLSTGEEFDVTLNLVNG